MKTNDAYNLQSYKRAFGKCDATIIFNRVYVTFDNHYKIFSIKDFEKRIIYSTRNEIFFFIIYYRYFVLELYSFLL